MLRGVKSFFVYLSIFFLCQSVEAQMDTIPKRLDPVSVTAERGRPAGISLSAVQQLAREEMTRLPLFQISDVFRHFSAVTVRDYGGVGGMKTVSVRGFGSQHTGVEYDGILLSDCQTGQIDFSKFSLENIEVVSASSGSTDDIFVPARSFSSASLLKMNTVRPVFSDAKPVNVRLNLTGGSFGLFSPTLVLENRIFKGRGNSPFVLSSSLNIRYLQEDGDYPFTLYYGGKSDSTSREIRDNSDVKTLSVEENLFFHFNARSHLSLKVFYYLSQRGLPGAVLYYHKNSEQRLNDENLFCQAHYENHFSQQFAYQLNAKFNYAEQHYLDPDYLNFAGKLDNRYIQREAYLSNTFLYKPLDFLSASISNDLVYSNMDANLADFVKPSRVLALTSLFLKFDTRYFDANLGLLHTFADNETRTGARARDFSRFSPSVSLSVKLLREKDLYLRAFYKDVFRLPTFNDLYYRLVGNLDLEPEKSLQFDLGLSYRTILRNKWRFSVEIDGYYNQVRDKIVAVPNKNLFFWTMLNLGFVKMGGTAVNLLCEYKPLEKLSFLLTGNYAYQYAVDVTDARSKVYLHQIPYVPRHSGSVTFSVITHWLDVSYTLIVSGKRYGLQQNIAESELEKYFDHAIVLSKEFAVWKSLGVGVKLELLNLSDKNYEIVKNYPMPGRSVRISGQLFF